jgi:uncharacterized membrane protein YfhO
MLSFIEWMNEEEKKKKKREKDERSNSQSSQQNGIISHQGKTVGDDSKIYTTTVHDFTQSKWEDYRGSN